MYERIPISIQSHLNKPTNHHFINARQVTGQFVYRAVQIGTAFKASYCDDQAWLSFHHNVPSLKCLPRFLFSSFIRIHRSIGVPCLKRLTDVRSVEEEEGSTNGKSRNANRREEPKVVVVIERVGVSLQQVAQAYDDESRKYGLRSREWVRVRSAVKQCGPVIVGIRPGPFSSEINFRCASSIPKGLKVSGTGANQ